MRTQTEISLISPRQLYDRLNAELDTPIGIHAVYSLMKRKDFPAVKIGGRLYAISSEVRPWLMSQTKKTA